MTKLLFTIGHVFIVTLRDRHTDDEHRACLALDSADAIVDEMKAGYARRYTWIRDFATEQRRHGWERVWSTGDDGPSIIVEKLELTS